MFIELSAWGRTACKEHWESGLIDLAQEAAAPALLHCDTRPTAVVVANALAGNTLDQRNTAAFVATALGLPPVETVNVECDEASGGAAVRVAQQLLAAGAHRSVLVLGVEKCSDALPHQLENFRAHGLDATREAGFGMGPAIAAAMGMRAYMHAHGKYKDDFYHLARLAHAHAADNDAAFFPWPLKEEQYRNSGVIADPLSACDNAPLCDGAAAVVLRAVDEPQDDRVYLAATASVTAAPGIHRPLVDLELPAAAASVEAALRAAGAGRDEVRVWELHDANAFLAALSIEAAGLAPAGGALDAARSGALDSDTTRLWSLGGHKARGNSGGAAGVYQVVEAAMRLRDPRLALDNAHVAVTQCLGSFGAQAVTTVLFGGTRCK